MVSAASEAVRRDDHLLFGLELVDGFSASNILCLITLQMRPFAISTAGFGQFR